MVGADGIHSIVREQMLRLIPKSLFKIPDISCELAILSTCVLLINVIQLFQPMCAVCSEYQEMFKL